MNHICMLCNKSFPSGRSLGGHMRSHVINSTDHNHHQQQQQKRQMKKLSSVNNGGFNSDGLVVLDKLCKECGKGFQSWKALFGHMKCHSEKLSNNTKHTLNQDSSHSDNQNSGADRIKKSRSRNKRMKRCTVTSTTVTTTITTASSSISMNANNSSNHVSTSIVSEIEQDQESEIAMCLMMLSRDEGKWGKIETETETEIGVDHPKISIQNDEIDPKLEDSKRRFECITCNKSFHSYQALGGHKASHKKKENPDQKLEEDNTTENNIFFNHDQTTKEWIIASGSCSSKKKEVSRGHECPICLKIFSSGQALGGHKRSHMIAETKLNQETSMNLIEKVNEVPVREIRGFIDLNMLPDTMEEDMVMNSNTVLGLLPTR